MRGVERARMYIIPVCVCLSVCLCLPEPGIELNGRAIACVYLGWKFDANTVPVAENRWSNLNQGVPTNIAESSAQKKSPLSCSITPPICREKNPGLVFLLLRA